MRLSWMLPLLLLAACGQRNDPGLGGLNRSQARQLNQAAAMLDANSVSAAAVDNEQEPSQ